MYKSCHKKGRSSTRWLPLEWGFGEGVTEASLTPANMQGGYFEPRTCARWVSFSPTAPSLPFTRAAIKIPNYRQPDLPVYTDHSLYAIY